jgi:hypothetical protein
MSGHWNRKSFIIVLAAIVLLLLVANWPLLVGQATPIWDAADAFAPYYTLIADHARQGQILLWDPWTECGVPICAHPAMGPFSPITVLFALATGPTLKGFVLYSACLWLGGGVGMLGLARHLGAPPWGALIVTAGFCLSGIFTGHAEHTSFIYSFAALPWIIWRLDASMLQQRVMPAVEAGAIWGLSALAGYPGILLSNAGLAVLWSLSRVVCEGRLGPDRLNDQSALGHVSPVLHGLRTAVIKLLLLAAVGLLAMAPPYVAFLTGTTGYTERAQPLDRGTASGADAWIPAAFTTFSSPDVARLLAPRASPETDISSLSAYAGMLPLWLAVAGLLFKPKDAWRWWLVAIALAGVGLALGRELPFRGWLYDLVPPSRYFRHAALFRSYTVFAICVLAALATGDLSTPAGIVALRRRLLISALLCAALGGLGYVAMAVSVSNLHSSLATFHVMVGWGAVAAIGLAAYSRQLRPTVPALMCLLAGIDAICTSWLTEDTRYTTEGNALVEWDWLGRHHSASLDLAEGPARVISFQRPVTDHHLVIKLPVLFGYTDTRNRFYKEMLETPSAAEAAIGADRIWFAKQAVSVPVNETSVRAFLECVNRLRAPPLVISNPEDALGSEGEPRDSVRVAWEMLPAAQRLPWKALRYTPTMLAFEVDCPRDGWLVVTDRWCKGWKAIVNGREQPIHMGMFVFRAVPVQAGRNVVEFTYNPIAFPWLVIISWLTVAVVAMLALRSCYDTSLRRLPPV